MHVYDIEEALADAEATSLRQAFRVLTHFPHEGHIEGAKSAEKLIDLFDTVTAALELDQAAMPETLCRTIANFTRVPIEPNATYAHGAIIASEFRGRWRETFLAHAVAPHAPGRSSTNVSLTTALEEQ